MNIKGQAPVDFIAELTYADKTKVAGMTRGTEVVKMVEKGDGENFTLEKEDIEQWILYVDDAYNENRVGVDMMLISPEGHNTMCLMF